MAVFLVALVFYLLTLAPTVLWGDDAEFQRRAFTLELGAGVSDHPLYLVWAHLFTLLPLGDVAWRVNLCSAVGAAAGVALAYATLRRLGAGRTPSLLGAGALAVCQAFWMHAVRAEVYSTYLALFALALYAGTRWLAGQRAGWLALAAFALALSSSVHLLALTALPGLLLLAARIRSVREAVAGAGGLLAGLLSLALFLVLAGPAELGGQMAALARASLSLQPARWAGDAALCAGYLLYQFPLTLPLALLGLRRLWRQSHWTCAWLLLPGLGDAAFAFDFQAPDRYVFYLPFYLTVALFIGAGAQTAWERWPRRGRQMAALAAFPLLLYLALPLTLNALQLNPLGLRELPYRNGNLFHLLPAKTGYVGPRLFGEATLRSLPAGAVVLADTTPRQNLLYLQRVEELRDDVEVVELYSGQGLQLPFVAAEIQRRPVFVAAIDRYLDRAEIEARYRIEPFGPIYRVVPR